MAKNLKSRIQLVDTNEHKQSCTFQIADSTCTLWVMRHQGERRRSSEKRTVPLCGRSQFALNICITVYARVVPPTCRPPSAEQRPHSSPEQPHFFPSRSARGPAESTSPLLSSCPLCSRRDVMRYIRRTGLVGGSRRGGPVGANFPCVSGTAILLSFITFWCAVCPGLAGSAPLATTNLPLSLTPATHTPSPFGGILPARHEPDGWSEARVCRLARR